MRRKFILCLITASLGLCETARGAVTFTKIADKTTVAPGETATFTSFHNLFIDGSDLTFFAFFSGGFGQYSATTTTGPFKVIDTNDPAPGHGAIGGFGGSGGVSGTNISLSIVYASGGGIWHGSVGSSTVTNILNTGTTAPGTTDPFTSLGDARLSGTNVVFQGFEQNGTNQGVYTDNFANTTLTKIADKTDIAPSSTHFTSFGVPVISGNNVVFWGQSGITGMYAGTVGTTGFTKVVDTTDTAPGHGVFTTFSQDPSIDGNQVAFQAGFSGGSGIYSTTLGTPGFTKLVEKGETAPDSGITFTSLQNPNIKGSDLAFIGGYMVASVTHTGIFIENDGVVSTVLKFGDPLFGSTVSSLFMGNSAYNGYQITINYGLADGSNGIAVANLPEPGTIGIMLILASCALLRRRLARRALRD